MALSAAGVPALSLDYKGLTEAERRLGRCALAGDMADFTEGAWQTANGTARPAIGAAFFRDLCLGKYGAIDSHGVSVTWARFEQSLDLRDTDLAYGLTFTGCLFRAGLDFNGARLRYLDFAGCTFTGPVSLWGMDIRTTLSMVEWRLPTSGRLHHCSATAGVDLHATHIGATLDLSGSHVHHGAANQ